MAIAAIDPKSVYVVFVAEHDRLFPHHIDPVEIGRIVRLIVNPTPNCG
jgi:hypothetical protein